VVGSTTAADELAARLIEAGGPDRHKQISIAFEQERARRRAEKADLLRAELAALQAATTGELSSEAYYDAWVAYFRTYCQLRSQNRDMWDFVVDNAIEVHEGIVSDLTAAYHAYLDDLVARAPGDRQTCLVINQLVRATWSSRYDSLTGCRRWESGNLARMGLPDRQHPLEYDMWVALLFDHPDWWLEFSPQELLKPNEAHRRAREVLSAWNGTESERLLAAQRVLSACRASTAIFDTVTPGNYDALTTLVIRLQRKLWPMPVESSGADEPVLPHRGRGGN